MTTEIQGFQLEDGSITLDKLAQSGASIGDAPIWNGAAYAPAPAGGGGSTANALATTGAPVNVSSAAPPTTGQALIATNATHATWQTLPSGGVTLDGAYDFGGSGAGRVITADAGAVHIDKPGVNANNAFEISVTDGSGAGQTITMGATTSGHGLSVTMTAGATGLAARFAGATISVPGAGLNSERFGVGAVANGADSTVIGPTSTDGGFINAAVLGSTNTVTGDYATIVGNNSTTGYNAIAVGAFASGVDNSVVVGSNAFAFGDSGIAIGQGANAGTIFADAACIAIGVGVSAVGGTRLTAIGSFPSIDALSGVQPSFDVVSIGGGGGVSGRQLVLVGSRGTEGLDGDNICALGYRVGLEDTIWMGQILLGVGAKPLDQPFTFVAGSGRQPVLDVWFGAGASADGPATTTIRGTRANSISALATPATPTATPTAGFSTWAPGTYNFFVTFFDGVGESTNSGLGSFTLVGGDYPLFDGFDENENAGGQYVYVESDPGGAPGVYYRTRPNNGSGTNRYLVSGLGPERFNFQPDGTEPSRGVGDPAYTRTGVGATINLAGGYGRTAADTGGNIGFYTSRTGTADVDTLAGYFNAADGSFSVPGAGVPDSERFGLNAVADGTSSTAVGKSATAEANYVTCVGAESDADQPYAVAVGFQAYAGTASERSVTVGSLGGSESYGSIVIGYDSHAATLGADHCVVVGYQTTVDSQRIIAMGANLTVASGICPFSVVIGDQSGAARDHVAVLGASSFAYTTHSVAIGPANVSGTAGSSSGGYNITLGNDNQAGVGSTGNPTDNIAIGDSSFAGVGSHAANGENIAIGETCIAGASSAGVTFQAQSNIAVGDQCVAGGDAGTVRFNIAIGEVCVAGSYIGGGQDNVAIGDGASALGDYNIAIGRACSTTDGSDHGIVIGDGATSTASEAIAIGHGASAGANEVALGIDTSASIKFKIGTTNGMQFGSGAAAKIGWWGATPVVRSAVATLVNNVTSGGTNDTIANFTDLTIYANDASTIRDDIYQLARKVREMTEALRTYGIFG